MGIFSRDEQDDFEESQRSPLNLYIWHHIPGIVFLVGGVEEVGIMAHSLGQAQQKLHLVLKEKGAQRTWEEILKMKHRTANNMEAFYLSGGFGR